MDDNQYIYGDALLRLRRAPNDADEDSLGSDLSNGGSSGDAPLAPARRRQPTSPLDQDEPPVRSRRTIQRRHSKLSRSSAPASVRAEDFIPDNEVPGLSDPQPGSPPVASSRSSAALHARMMNSASLTARTGGSPVSQVPVAPLAQAARAADAIEPPAMIDRPPVKKTIAPRPASAASGAAQRRTTGSSKGTLGSALVISGLALCMGAYALNIGTVQTWVADYLNQANSTAEASGAAYLPLMAQVLPWLMLLPALLLLYVVLRTFGSMLGLRSRSRTSKVSHDELTDLDDFKEAAGEKGVHPRTAYQGFVLLQPHLPEGHSLALSDWMERDLGMSAAAVRTMRLALLANTHREYDAGMRLAPVNSVLGMLISAQQAPRRSSEDRDIVVPVPGDPGGLRRRE